MDRKEIVAAKFQEVQEAITTFLGQETGQVFLQDEWSYTKGFGGGRSRVYEGNVKVDGIEKGGVNWSGIGGPNIPAPAATKFKLAPDTPFFATGVSLVIHPSNAHVPTIHMNIRYFEAGPLWWFGGGIDLTPYYPYLSQVQEFHRGLQRVHQKRDVSYNDFKQWCDRYFYLPHRKEARGVGGVFFDHLNTDFDRNFAFVSALGFAFIDLYRPFWQNVRIPMTPNEREYQLYRRGRYVEFNLLYDRGTKFGIESEGRTESILMSLPNIVHWRYNWQPAEGSREAETMRFYLQAQDWINLDGGVFARVLAATPPTEHVSRASL